MKPILRKIGGEVRGLHEAAYLLGFFAFLTQILALLRDRLFASSFGAGPLLDSYYAAFKIPDLLFVGVASLLSLYVLIPFVTERMTDREELRRFVGSMFTMLSTLLALGGIVLFFAAPYLVGLLFPGFAVGTLTDTVILTRILLLQAFFLGISNLVSSVTQTFRRFVIIAATPLLYNIGIIVGVLWLYPTMGASGLAWGAVLGALLHFSLHVPFLTKEGLWPRLALPRLDEAKRVFILSIPRTFSLTANNVALLVYAAFASVLSVGSLAIFTFAYNLQNAPITIIGLSYSVAAFPSLAALFAKNEQHKFLEEVISAARHIIFWTLPVITLLIVLRAHIVRVILGSGAFDWTDTRLTAAALALFALSLTAHALVLLLVRAYYAAGNTRTPLLATLFAVPSGIASAYMLVQVFENSPAFRAVVEELLRVEGLPGTESLMLPLGYSIGIIVQALLLAWFFTRDFGGFLSGVRGVFSRSLAGALAGGVAAYAVLNVVDSWFDENLFSGIFFQGLIAGLTGLLVTILMLKLLKSPELSEAWNSLHAKFWRTDTVVPVEEA